jgi:hypothetical protein
MKLFDRINIIQIFIKHFNTLYDHGVLTWTGKRKMPFADKFTFFYCPSVFAFILVVPLQLFINDNYLNIIITSLSIFVGLLFGFLTLVFDIVKNEKIVVQNPNATDEQKLKLQLVKELFINIAFAIALSILSIVAALLTRFHPTPIILQLQKLTCYYYIRKLYLLTTNLIAIFLVLLFVATLLMILKRFFIIFTNDFKDSNTN